MSITVGDQILERLRELRAVGGFPNFEASQCLPKLPYADYAKSIGLDGLRVDDPDDLGGAWDTALAANRPFLLEVITDPEVPPLPPHVEFDQAKQVLAAMLRGDPAAGGIVRQGFKAKVQEFIHR